MTLAQAKKLVSDLGLTLKYNRDYDEYTVNYKGGSSKTIYHTSDLQDAIGTAKAMSRRSNSGLMSNIKKIIPVDAIIQTTDGKIHALRTKNPGRTKNVAMGYMAGGVFHPIRASADYDESRVGESRPGKRKKAKKSAIKKTKKRVLSPKEFDTKFKKKKAKKKPVRKAMRSSRGTYWGD